MAGKRLRCSDIHIFRHELNIIHCVYTTCCLRKLLPHWLGGDDTMSSGNVGIDDGSDDGGMFRSVHCGYGFCCSRARILCHETICTKRLQLRYSDIPIFRHELNFIHCVYTTCFSGNYCPSGSAAMIQCPPGTWGSTTGLTSAACTGPCAAGIGF